ncbi:MAG: DM13 domain-containing protein [Paracoccaceae bacterium]|nr:DM13 domain-containing protein [Paracoccaceae bacterium]
MKLFAPFLLIAAMAVALPQIALAGAGSGSFTGASGHVTSGSVEVIQTGDGWEVHLKDDFAFDGAPDPRVGFGQGGKFAKGTDFEPLRQNAGAQVYKVPAEINPDDFDTVFIWCRKFSVPLGSAALGN